MNDVRGTRSYGSAAIEMAYIATGRLDAYITMRLAPWDFAAGAILIEETGGKTSNLFGETIGLHKWWFFFCAKPGLHEAVLEKYIHSN